MKILNSLIKKEFYQIVRDPSSIIIAFVLPLILLFIFANAINLDNNTIKIGLVSEGKVNEAADLVASLENTKFLDVSRYANREAAEHALLDDKIKAIVILPNNFESNLKATGAVAKLQLIIDGSEPNMSIFIENYVNTAVMNWQKMYLKEMGVELTLPLDIQPIVWFNPELKSRNLILPGSISVIMTLVGMILTALVVAREWEKGTMEALLTTAATRMDMLLAKYISYYVLAIGSTIFCTFLCIVVFGIEFKGSYLVYFIVSSLFISTSLGQGFFISTLTKNQFLASISASTLGFLPAVMLSGILFEISSMPLIIRLATYIVPAKYFIPCINSLFMVGNVWSVLLPQSLFLLVYGVVLFIIIYFITSDRLE